MSVTEKSQKPAAKRSWKGPACLTILLVCLPAIVLWMWQFRPRVPLLLTVATQAVPKERFSGSDFAWLSNDEYVSFGKDNRTLCRYHLNRGNRTQLIESLGSRSWCSSMQASPDGKWLHWVKCTGGPRYGDLIHIHQYFTRTDDGRTFPDEYMFYGLWESDSRHILGVVPYMSVNAGKTCVIVDILANRIRRTLPVATDVPTNLGNSIEVAPGRLLEISQEANSNSTANKNEPVEIREYKVYRTLHLTHKWPVAPPHDTTLTDTANAHLSPTGDRIAWLVDAEQADAGRVALHRLLPFIQAPAHRRQEIWISRLEGKGMRLVGQAPIKTRNGNEMRLTDLRWLPDGKHLSFSYDDALWTVSAQR